jgi:hypothetical protein
MKRFRCLLLDAGPILKLFELGIWERFITLCDVTVTPTVRDEVQFFGEGLDKQYIDLFRYVETKQIALEEASIENIQSFHQTIRKLNAEIHDGEKETLAILGRSAPEWKTCSSDAVVYRVLGYLGRGEQGISLDEILRQVGLGRDLEWRFTERFRIRYTQLGQVEGIQHDGIP